MFGLNAISGVAASTAGPSGFFDGLRSLREYERALADLKKLSAKELRDMGVEGSLEEHARRLIAQRAGR